MNINKILNELIHLYLLIIEIDIQMSLLFSILCVNI